MPRRDAYDAVICCWFSHKTIVVARGAFPCHVQCTASRLEKSTLRALQCTWFDRCDKSGNGCNRNHKSLRRICRIRGGKLEREKARVRDGTPPLSASVVHSRYCLYASVWALFFPAAPPATSCPHGESREVAGMVWFSPCRKASPFAPSVPRRHSIRITLRVQANQGPECNRARLSVPIALIEELPSRALNADGPQHPVPGSHRQGWSSQRCCVHITLDRVCVITSLRVSAQARLQHFRRRDGCFQCSHSMPLRQIGAGGASSAIGFPRLGTHAARGETSVRWNNGGRDLSFFPAFSGFPEFPRHLHVSLPSKVYPLVPPDGWMARRDPWKLSFWMATEIPGG